MLKYSYSRKTPNAVRRVEIDEMYVSPDLEFISGCTVTSEGLYEGERVWIRSPYFPRDIMTTVENCEIVRRNGYITVPKILEVHNADCFSEGIGPVNTAYVEYKGNTYFKGADGFFIIEGKSYNGSGSTITVDEKVYIENEELTVSGITYNALVNNEGKLLLSDYIGNSCPVDKSWDVQNVSSGSTYVEKVVIGNETPSIITCNGVSGYGFRAYIQYKDEKCYIEYYEDDGTKAGVLIEGVYYLCNALYDGNESGSDSVPNIYDRKAYSVDDTTGNAYMKINGDTYIISFEPTQMAGTGMLCVETTYPDMPILLGDKLRLRTTDVVSELEVLYTNDERGFVYYCGHKFQVTYNLCDKVIMDDVEYDLVFSDPESIVSGKTIAYSIMPDGSVMNFKVIESKVVDSITVPTKVKRVELVNGEYKFQYNVHQGETGVEYGEAPDYEVRVCHGIMIGDYAAEIQQKEYLYNLNEEDVSGSVYVNYDYIVVNSPLTYTLTVTDTVGNNKIICTPDVNYAVYGESGSTMASTEILSSIYGGEFVVEKRRNTFGTNDLYWDSWITESLTSESGTSVYELANVKENINVLRNSGNITLQLGLFRDTSNDILQEDLITNRLYTDVAEEGTNPIVDMDKDMYTPVIANREVDGLEFNLHFRTRDLETWKINVDEGVGYDGNQLSAAYQYTNWFVTDYFPYNHILSGTTGNNASVITAPDVCVRKSDLLGFLYFTTNDVQEKREKLRKSFLRLTFFDSINPEKQNMLGTTTMFLDCERYFDTLYTKKDDVAYSEVAMSRNPDRVSGKTENPTMQIKLDPSVAPTVLTEAYAYSGETVTVNEIQLYEGEGNPRLDSKIEVPNPSLRGDKSSEGYFAYILKEFGDRNEPKTIYMKAEFFHAGVGIKIPMVIATDSSKNAIQNDEWLTNLDEFKKGYNLSEVFERLYVPIRIQYSSTLRKFVYEIENTNGFPGAIENESENKLVFNLFELKVRT